MIHALRILNGPYRSSEDSLFVGQQLRGDKKFCLRVAEVQSTTARATLPFDPYPKHRERLFRLTDLSDSLQHDPAVVVEFCRFDEGTMVLAPKALRRDCAVVREACNARPISLAHALPCGARSDLKSSVSFVIRLLTESAYSVLLENCYRRLPSSIQEDQDVVLAAVMASHSSLVHRRWKGNAAEFWCDAIRRTDSNLHR